MVASSAEQRCLLLTTNHSLETHHNSAAPVVPLLKLKLGSSVTQVMDVDYGESYIDLEDDKEFSFSDTDSIDDCGNVEHKNVDVHSEEHEGADDQNEPTKHADADVAPDVYTNILELTEADIWDKAQVNRLRAQGVRTCQIMGYMLAQKGGYQGLGWIKKDLYNHFERQKHALIKDGDARAAVSYLQGKADNDPMFFPEYLVSDDGTLQHLFWADGTSRADFQCFGDVVAFDSTYKKNKYNLPLVIFSGKNHHVQTVLFGCALVCDETTATYKWLLKTFLVAMCNKHPTSVVTDGDNAMREAIKEVFPNATHRLCAWHLQKNAFAYSSGIPCCHIICAMRHEHADTFPASLIMKRWLKDAKRSFIASTEIEEMDSDMMMLTRLGVLSVCCNRLCHDAARKQEHFTFIRDEILKLHDKLKKTRTCPLLRCEDDDISINDDSSSPDSHGTRRQEDNEDMSSDENNIHDMSNLYESSKGKQKVNHRSTHKKVMKAECLTHISMDNSKKRVIGGSHGKDKKQKSLLHRIVNSSWDLCVTPNHISPYAYGTPWQGMSMPPIYGVAPSYPPLTQVQFPTQMSTYFGGMPMDNSSGGTWVDMLQNVKKKMHVDQFASALRIEINQAFALLRDIASGRDLKKFLSLLKNGQNNFNSGDLLKVIVAVKLSNMRSYYNLGFNSDNASQTAKEEKWDKLLALRFTAQLINQALKNLTDFAKSNNPLICPINTVSGAQSAPITLDYKKLADEIFNRLSPSLSKYTADKKRDFSLEEHEM
ncbi:hypothetical protein RIF29_04223 [Crotalaria pallida]|uniref:MULE transposase domain-containing protein n=1 Tax=Crotalaria pallida TaxID=3830 RepID=A0AAN9J0S7_CROPI